MQRVLDPLLSPFHASEEIPQELDCTNKQSDTLTERNIPF